MKKITLLTTVLLILATFVLGACGKKEATGLAAIKKNMQLYLLLSKKKDN